MVLYRKSLVYNIEDLDSEAKTISEMSLTSLLISRARKCRRLHPSKYIGVMTPGLVRSAGMTNEQKVVEPISNPYQ
jgi:hypothetical protein